MPQRALHERQVKSLLGIPTDTGILYVLPVGKKT